MVRCGSHKLGAAAILAFALAALPDAAFAQVNVEAMQGVQFDFLAPGARSMAMGGAFVAVADDATAALSNPAGLSKLTRSEVSFELRTRQFKVPYAFSGRLSGTPTGIGVDNVSTATFHEASTSEGKPGFSVSRVRVAGTTVVGSGLPARHGQLLDQPDNCGAFHLPGRRRLSIFPGHR